MYVYIYIYIYIYIYVYIYIFISKNYSWNLLFLVEHFTPSIFDQSKLSVTDGLLWGAHARSHCNVSRGTGAEGTGMRWDGYGMTSLTHVKVAEFYHLKHTFWKWMNIMDEHLKYDVWMHISKSDLESKGCFQNKKTCAQELAQYDLPTRSFSTKKT